MNTSGLLQLISEKKLDLQKCIICQKVKDNKGNNKLTSTIKGRENIICSSRILNDRLTNDLTSDELLEIKYHVNTCYTRYIRMKERAENRAPEIVSEETQYDNEIEDCEVRAKRRKTVENKEQKNLCIICDQVKCKGDKKLMRICETKRAKLFIRAVKFNKDNVYSRCSIYETPGDIFAADIIYHRNCMSQYILTFQRDIEDVMNYSDIDINSNMTQLVFEEMLSTLCLKQHAYSLSECREILNNKLAEAGSGIFYIFIFYDKITMFS